MTGEDLLASGLVGMWKGRRDIPRLAAEIDRTVGRRGRSRFLVQAATFELKRQRQLAALKVAAGAWKAHEHPELARGVAAHVKRLRREAERRFRKAAPLR